MEQSTTQNPANPGASNAADFQPGTQNPQSAPAQLFSQPNGVQSGGQDDLLENKDVRITVPVTKPATSTPQTAQVKGGNGEVVVAIISAVLIGVWLLWRRARTAPAPVVEEEPVVVPAPVKATPVKAVPAPKKPAPKKSKSQRKKRSRR